MEQQTGQSRRQTGTEQTVEQVKESARQAASQAGDTIRGQAERRKGRAAGTLHSVAGALRESGNHLTRQNEPVGRYAEHAAERVERIAGYLENRDVNQIVGEASTLARRQPVLFLAGAVALGAGAARFLKSSGTASSTRASVPPRSYAQGGYKRTATTLTGATYGSPDVGPPTDA